MSARPRYSDNPGLSVIEAAERYVLARWAYIVGQCWTGRFSFDEYRRANIRVIRRNITSDRKWSAA